MEGYQGHRCGSKVWLHGSSWDLRQRGWEHLPVLAHPKRWAVTSGQPLLTTAPAASAKAQGHIYEPKPETRSGRLGFHGFSGQVGTNC